ncbi:MAG TPA: Fe2+-dependent dioxygenase [Steroidobacteraceae bacterium]|jgi:PKHD-type hydroxylase|nr:Fe2+-dependent dioxygenase [Steroidobacteraceae bacterium]
MFLRIPNVLSGDELTRICAALTGAEAPWLDGRVTAGHQGAPVKNNQQLDQASAMARELGGAILASLERNPLFISAILPDRVYPPMFNRYGAGMRFGTHVDGVVRRVPGSAHQLRTDLSATLFLAPAQSYDGGELVIESDFGDQCHKLAAGDLLVYSAGLRHRVNAVTRGQRLASIFWIQSLIRDDLKREQLFELDRTIQRLTQLGSDADSMVRLAAHYHGLLRRWSEL